MLQLSPERILRYQVSSKAEKLVSVLATCMPVTGTRKETIETTKAVKTAKAVETVGTGKDGKKSKDELEEPCTSSVHLLPHQL